MSKLIREENDLDGDWLDDENDREPLYELSIEEKQYAAILTAKGVP